MSGWPKGKPRKGHVNKDGSTHAKWGSRAGSKAVEVGALLVKAQIEPEAPKEKNWGVKMELKVHHPQDRCPKCEFPEALAGYCGACGYTAPIHANPQGSLHGPKFDINGKRITT